MLLAKFGQAHFGRIWAFMFMFNGIGFIVFGLFIGLVPIAFLWSLVFCVASGSSIVILLFAYPAMNDFLAYEKTLKSEHDA